MDVNEKIIKWNETESDVDFSNNIGTMLHNSAVKNANSVAAVDKNGNITYEQLDKYSNAICNLLLEKSGQLKNKNICILTEDVKERLCYITGILKAGMTYVPLDVKAPVSRNKLIFNNVGSNFILTDTNNIKSAAKISDSDDVIIKAFNTQQLSSMNCRYTEVKHSINDTAYIIHTSGSTGIPKGVKVSERALINFCAATFKIIDITPDDRTCMLQNVSFDYSILDMFPFMLGGAALYFVPAEIKFDINSLNNFMMENNITLQAMTTALYHIFCELDNPILKKVMIAGEKMVKYIPQSYEVYNFYGPTEAAVYITYAKINKQTENIPIGRPVINNKVIIVTEDNRIADIGEKGEICLSGLNLADGYINNDAETKKRFVPSVLDPNEIMYRTGDIGEWSENGELLCYGRIDFQIKHRGYRIELDEINYYISKTKLVTDSIVLYNDKVENKYIVCFYSTAENDNISVDVIAEKIKNDMPEYMLPAKWVKVDKLPLNDHGKVDRNALIELLASHRSSNIINLSHEEKVIRDIWSDILDINQDFDEEQSFRNLGGHSLISMMMLRRLNAELNINISFTEHLQAETLKGHLELIKNKNRRIKDVIKKIWAEKLDVDDNFDENASFNSMGGHSILSMLMLKAVKSEIGVNITLAEFLKHDTFNEFVRLAEEKSDDSSEKNSKYEDDYANKFEPFGLNEMQQAYYIGRFDGIELGSIPTHLYLEIECRDYDNDKFIRVLK